MFNTDNNHCRNTRILVHKQKGVYEWTVSDISYEFFHAF